MNLFMKLKIKNDEGFLSEKNDDIKENKLNIGDIVECSKLANNAYLVTKPDTKNACVLYTFNVEKI